jgi:DNA invertase Pin-like site-specific DNA recombinase
MDKIKETHLARKAFIYVRQSSLAQVQQHQESTRRQYQLQERAIGLGWRKEQVEVVDEDQGQSGASAGNRSGFKRIVSEVALGQGGAVFGLEVSRVARSCADWYRLLEVAALAGTLIVDEEGVYDPNHYNDRLLLGLKGTLSEAELHFLKQRMIGGRRAKARRAEFRIRLPAGYVWEDEERILIDPDERVRDAVYLFFHCFDRIGTALGTTRYFEENHQMFPRRDGWGSMKVPVAWGQLSPSRAVAILRNPIYAGIYPYDRNNPMEENPEDVCLGGRILIPDSHHGYITVEQYEKNISRLENNRSFLMGLRKKGSAREGGSLLQGIVLCGLCGRHMGVRYGKDKVFIYTCMHPSTHRICQHINGRHVDPLVEEILFAAFTQEEFDLALDALTRLKGRASDLEKQWEKRIEAARYEADKAARRYYRVEPENRLVARTLESEWNARLEDVERLEEEYEKIRQTPPFTITQEQQNRIMALAEDLPRLWKSPTTQNSQRKQLLRILIEDVTLRNQDDPFCVEVAIRWKTDFVSRHQANRVHPRPHSTPREVIDRIEQLYVKHIDREIAEVLNNEGFRTGYGRAFTQDRVAKLRYYRGLTKRHSSKNNKSTERGK